MNYQIHAMPWTLDIVGDYSGAALYLPSVIQLEGPDHCKISGHRETPGPTQEILYILMPSIHYNRVIFERWLL